MERVVRFPVRTILTVLGLIVAVWVLIHVVVIARSVIVYVLIAIFLTLAINPLVAWLMRRGVHSRGLASATACLLVLIGIAAIGYAFIPTLIDNVNNFVDAVPGYVHDLTKGKGRLGFLETKYHVVERLDHYVKQGGAKKLLGLSGAAISVTKGVLGLLVGLLDLLPLVGATIAAVIVAAVAFLHSLLAGIVILVFFVVYQQVENHILQPLVYHRTVALSPLAILIAVLVGAELAGVLGALAAIPVAGAIQVLILDFLRVRRER